MLNEFSRTELILGHEAMDRLKNARVAVFGVGGVGSFVVEALTRAGIGHLAIFDDDEVSLTNLNRQLLATHETIGRPKVEVMRERMLTINPRAEVEANICYLDADTLPNYPLDIYDYVVDAIDSVTSKLLLVQETSRLHVPIISCMGTGNKLHPELLTITDLYKTSVCPLAKVMRRECKVRGIKKLKVLYSPEQPLKPVAPEAIEDDSGSVGRRSVPGSVSFVPSTAGLMIAGEVVRTLAGIQ